MPTASIIYHSNCPDGFTAAWLMHKCIGSWYLKVDLIPASYQKPPPEKVGSDVYLVDFCYEPHHLKDLQARSHNLTILDHHETAAGWMNEAWPGLVIDEWSDQLSQVTDVKVLDQEHSGAMLAQLWTGSNVPFVRHVEDRDLWRHQYKETEPIVQAMLSYDYTLENWDRFLAMGTWELLSQGEPIIRYRNRLIEQVVAEAYQTELLGHQDIWVAPSPYTIGSDVAGILAARDPDRFAATYVDKPNGLRKWRALRQDGDERRRTGGGCWRGWARPRSRVRPAAVKIYLGTGDPTWIGRSEVPLFASMRKDLMTSRTRFGRRASLNDWALDSGGFTQILRGGWTMEPQEYLDRVYVLADRCPGLVWAAPQDWMCEPPSIAATGKTIQQHQRLTVENYLALREIDDRGLIIPVVQGWTPGQHELCVEMYAKAGVDLRDNAIVGVGTICRRQATNEVEGIVRRLAGYGLSLHGFGIKMKGLEKYASCLTSCDSTAWSYRAWMASRDGKAPLCGDGTHKSCSQCFKWAHMWYDRVTALTQA